MEVLTWNLNYNFGFYISLKILQSLLTTTTMLFLVVFHGLVMLESVMGLQTNHLSPVQLSHCESCLSGPRKLWILKHDRSFECRAALPTQPLLLAIHFCQNKADCALPYVTQLYGLSELRRQLRGKLRKIIR